MRREKTGSLARAHTHTHTQIKTISKHTANVSITSNKHVKILNTRGIKKYTNILKWMKNRNKMSLIL